MAPHDLSMPLDCQPSKVTTMKFGFRDKTAWQVLTDIAIPMSTTLLSVWLALHLLSIQLSEGRIAELDKNRQLAFQSYLDKMTQLLFDAKIDSGKQDKGSFIAQAMTLNLLDSLDGTRKGQVIQFLYQTGLIKYNEQIANSVKVDAAAISLRGANLSGMDLQGATKGKVDLRGSVFWRSNMRNANLSGDVNLSGSLLDFVDFSDADLSNANLSKSGLVLAKLNGANLDRTNFRDSCLRGADLREAKNLSQADLQGAKYVDRNDKFKTIFPNGFKPAEHRMVSVATCG